MEPRNREAVKLTCRMFTAGGFKIIPTILTLIYLLARGTCAPVHRLRLHALTGTDLNGVGARVVNGVPVTDRSEYPFVVDLSFDERAISTSRFCTGTLIQPEIVLTAAHCVLNEGYTAPVYATVGRIILRDGHKDNAQAETFRTVASIVHENYGGLGSRYDVALMLLNGSSAAVPVSLTHARPGENDTAWVVGYGIKTVGTIEESANTVEIMSERLQKTSLRIMKNEFCDIPDAEMKTDDGMLCTAGVKDGSSACKGDSGGGLFRKECNVEKSSTCQQNVKDIFQVGIVSYGASDCHSEDSGVFTDIASVREWIEASSKKLHDAFELVHVEMNDTSVHAVGELPIHGPSSERYLRHSNEENTRQYKIRTNFANERTVKVTLCSPQSKEKPRLFISTMASEKHRQLCLKGKASELKFRSKVGAYTVAISTEATNSMKLSIST